MSKAGQFSRLLHLGASIWHFKPPFSGTSRHKLKFRKRVNAKVQNRNLSARDSRRDSAGSMTLSQKVKANFYHLRPW